MHKGIRALTLVAVFTVIVMLAVCGFLGLMGTAHAPRKTLEEYRAIARSGRPIVSAIYAYKYSNGLWPQRIEDLVPDYLSEEAVHHWQYAWLYWGKWELINQEESPVGVAVAQYIFDKVGGKWVLSSREGEVPLYVPQRVPARPSISEEELRLRTIALFRERISREPDSEAHPKGLISYLIRTGRLPEAQEACSQFNKKLSDHWGEWVKASVDASSGHGDQALRDLRFLPDYESFIGHFRVAHVCAVMGQPTEAAGEVKLALGYQPEGAVGYIPEVFLYECARYAFLQKDYELVLKVADAYDRIRYNSEESKHALRAAAMLGLGKFDEAEVHYNAAIAHTSAAWANVEGLLDAIHGKRRDYVWHGMEGCLGPFTLLEPYE